VRFHLALAARLAISRRGRGESVRARRFASRVPAALFAFGRLPFFRRFCFAMARSVAHVAGFAAILGRSVSHTQWGEHVVNRFAARRRPRAPRAEELHLAEAFADPRGRTTCPITPCRPSYVIGAARPTKGDA